MIDTDIFWNLDEPAQGRVDFCHARVGSDARLARWPAAGSQSIIRRLA